MRNIFKNLLIVCASFIMSACENHKTTQRIYGAGDCSYCQLWSWSNGVATTNDEDREGRFEFTSIVNGELSFSYQEINRRWGDNILEIYIQDKMFFSIKHENTYEFTKASIGSVKVGDEISFSGRGYKVKDIKIVGTASDENKNNSTENNWDF